MNQNGFWSRSTQSGKYTMSQRKYIAIDLKSFYASVECMERGLDPLTTNLVVADPSRTEKTICLAVSPSLKSYGVPGRPRLFEVYQRLEEVNSERKMLSPDRELHGRSYFQGELEKNPSLEIDFITAPPRMALYMEISTKIYEIYLKYIAPEDIHVYSVDEVFIDATDYLKTYKMTAHELAITMIRDVLSQTGITATCGIGSNMYLCKIAMDITAKHSEPDRDGVRIAELDEKSYREKLWSHTPLTSFWRIGKGYERRLNKLGLYTMGDVARFSISNEDLLYKEFGINAELLIDHAWGREPCRISDIKSYIPENRSLSLGQVLSSPYSFDKARIVIREMTEALVLDLVKKGLVADQMVLTVGYDKDNSHFDGTTEQDRYGRTVPRQAHSSINLNGYTSSGKQICEAVLTLFDTIVNKELYIRRMYVVANHTITEEKHKREAVKQLSLFEEPTEKKEELAEKEKNIQKAVLLLREKYGKNAVLKGTNLKEGATAIERNKQIGGHKA